MRERVRQVRRLDHLLRHKRGSDVRRRLRNLVLYVGEESHPAHRHQRKTPPSGEVRHQLLLLPRQVLRHRRITADRLVSENFIKYIRILI